MKTSHKSIALVEEALKTIGYLQLFEITEDLAQRVTHLVDPELSIRHKNKSKESNSYKNAMSHSYQITKRDLLKILWLRNGKSSKNISRNYGYLYILSNPAWKSKLKVGVTIDIPSRLSSYQTSSPFRDFKIEKYYLVKNPYDLEKTILSSIPSQGEWIDVENLSKVREIIAESSAAM